MSGYTKLFNSILDSTVWQEPDSTVRVWITMLAMADAGGIVAASVPGLASRARVPIEACVTALKTFMEPDQWSRTKDHEGRRIVEVDGGWALLNHGKYRAARAEEDRREYQRQLMAERRRLVKEAEEAASLLAEKLAPVSTPLAMLAGVSRSEPPLAQASASASAESGTDQEHAQPAVARARPSRPIGTHARFDEFWSVYPRHKGKAAALKTWVVKNLDAIADTIIADVIKRGEQEWKFAEPQFIPYGSTYVSERRWEDGIDKPSAPKQLFGQPQSIGSRAASRPLE